MHANMHEYTCKHAHTQTLQYSWKVVRIVLPSGESVHWKPFSCQLCAEQTSLTTPVHEAGPPPPPPPPSHHDDCRPDQCTLHPCHTQFLPCHSWEHRSSSLSHLVTSSSACQAGSRGLGASTGHECESLHIQACGRGSWAVREFPSHSHIRQQCGHTWHFVVFLPDVSGPPLYSRQTECSEWALCSSHHCTACSVQKQFVYAQQKYNRVKSNNCTCLTCM